MSNIPTFLHFFNLKHVKSHLILMFFSSTLINIYSLINYLDFIIIIVLLILINLLKLTLSILTISMYFNFFIKEIYFFCPFLFINFLIKETYLNPITNLIIIITNYLLINYYCFYCLLKFS
jgi:hypothetical protein